MLRYVDHPVDLDLERLSSRAEQTDVLGSGPARQTQVRPVGPGIQQLNHREVRLFQYPIARGMASGQKHAIGDPRWKLRMR